MNTKLSKSSIPYKGNISVASFSLNDESEVPVKPISQYIYIETGAISAGTTFFISLSQFETALKPISLWVDATNESKEQIELSLHKPNGEDTERVILLNLNRAEIPYVFPPVIILPQNTIQLKPKHNIDNCFLFFEPAYLLASVNLNRFNLRDESYSRSDRA